VDVGDRTSELAALSLDAAVALEGGPELTFYFSRFTSITPRKVIHSDRIFPRAEVPSAIFAPDLGSK
jgi:hypothetical protein